MNVGNLLNKKWGLIDDYGFYATRRVGNFAGIDPATGKYVYSFTGADDSSIQKTTMTRATLPCRVGPCS